MSNLQEGKPTIEQLFKQYYPRLSYFAYKMIDNMGMAKDIAQDAFVKLWNHEGSYESESSAKNFLYLSVRNACLNEIRHQKVEQMYISSLDKEAVEEEKGLEHIIRAEVLGEIYTAIEELPQGCRQVLKLAYFEGLKNEAIANQLGVSVNTVKTQKARALQLLRLKLDADTFLLLLFFLGL